MTEFDPAWKRRVIFDALVERAALIRHEAQTVARLARNWNNPTTQQLLAEVREIKKLAEEFRPI